jgi:hypothetical protein
MQCEPRHVPRHTQSDPCAGVRHEVRCSKPILRVSYHSAFHLPTARTHILFGFVDTVGSPSLLEHKFVFRKIELLFGVFKNRH